MTGKVIDFIGRRQCSGDCQQGRRCTCAARWRDTADTQPMIYSAPARRPRHRTRAARVLRALRLVAGGLMVAAVIVAAILVERHLRGLP